MEGPDKYQSAAERRLSLLFTPRPTTSYQLGTETPQQFTDRRTKRMSFHTLHNNDRFDFEPPNQPLKISAAYKGEELYVDPFSEQTSTAMTNTAIKQHVRRHSSIAQSFRSGVSAIGRRLSLGVRSGKSKQKDETTESGRFGTILYKKKSQILERPETGYSVLKTTGLFHSMRLRRRPSMPLLNSELAEKFADEKTECDIELDDSPVGDSRLVPALSNYASGGAGARAAAAAQNEALHAARETPLPSYHMISTVSPEMQDSESGIGISLEDEQRSSTSVHIARCDPVEILAPELLEHVFLFLDANALRQADLVSKKWQEQSRSQVVWREVFYREYASRRPTRLYSQPSTPGMGKNVPGQDYRKLFQVRQMIDQRWRDGKAAAIYLNGHKDSVYCVQFDENKIITGSRDHTIRVWDARTYQCTMKLGPLNNRRERAAAQRQEVEPSGMVPFFTSEATSPEPQSPQLEICHSASVLCLQYDDELLVTGSSDFTCIVWSIKQGYKPLFQLRGHTAGVLDVCIDKNRIITCSKDTNIKIWDRHTGDLVRTLAGHRGPVNAVQVRGNLLASASGDGMSKLWRLQDGACIKEFHSYERGLACVEFSEDGRTIFAGGNDHVIYEYNTITGNIERELRGHKDLVRSLHLDSFNNRIISGSYDHSIKVWNAKQDRTVAEGGMNLNLEGWTSSWMLAAKSNYRKIACASQDGRVVIVDFGFGIDGVHLVEA